MVELEQSAEPFPTSDCANSGRGLCVAIDQGIGQALMVPFEMVVSHVFGDGQSQVPLSKRNQSFKALALNRKHKSLRESDQVRTVCWQPHRFDTSLVQGLSRCLRVQWIPVEQQIPLAQQEPIDGTDEVSCHLIHPGTTRVHYDSKDLDLPACDVDREQH